MHCPCTSDECDLYWLHLRSKRICLVPRLVMRSLWTRLVRKRDEWRVQTTTTALYGIQPSVARLFPSLESFPFRIAPSSRRPVLINPTRLNPSLARFITCIGEERPSSKSRLSSESPSLRLLEWYSPKLDHHHMILL